MGWDYSQSSNAYTPHTSRDGLALESEAPMGLTGLGGVRSLELHNAGSGHRLSPTSAEVLSNVEAAAKQWKDQRRNRQNGWSSVD